MGGVHPIAYPASPGNSEASFIELEPPAPANLSQVWDVELELGAGVVLRLRTPGC